MAGVAQPTFAIECGVEKRLGQNSRRVRSSSGLRNGWGKTIYFSYRVRGREVAGVNNLFLLSNSGPSNNSHLPSSSEPQRGWGRTAHFCYRVRAFCVRSQNNVAVAFCWQCFQSARLRVLAGTSSCRSTSRRCWVSVRPHLHQTKSFHSSPSSVPQS